MKKYNWSKPYCGYSHIKIGYIQYTLCEYPSFTLACVINCQPNPFKSSELDEKVFTDYNKAQRYLERKMP